MKSSCEILNTIGIETVIRNTTANEYRYKPASGIDAIMRTMYEKPIPANRDACILRKS